jgi:hypothetical protein
LGNRPYPDRAFDLSFVVTGTFFNSAWKYRERAFRYLLLDSGHLVENLNLALRAEGLFPRMDYDFEDDKISALLALDEEKEVPLVFIHINIKENRPKERFRTAPFFMPCPQGRSREAGFNDIEYKKGRATWRNLKICINAKPPTVVISIPLIRGIVREKLKKGHNFQTFPKTGNVPFAEPAKEPLNPLGSRNAPPWYVLSKEERCEKEDPQ